MPFRLAPVSSPTSAKGPTASLQDWQRPAWIVFLLLLAIQFAKLLLRAEGAGDWGWTETAFWSGAALASGVSLGRRLPIQNVAMAFVVIALLSLVFELIAAATFIPFGPRLPTDALGKRLAGLVPWGAPLVWIVVLINGRGVARLMARPWRKVTYYGFWVIGLTLGLTLVFALVFEPVASQVKHYWSWRHVPVPGSWQGTPWFAFLGWVLTAGITLAFATPWLINKHPVKQPPDYHPLSLWILLHAWLVLANALYGNWLAAGFGLVATSLIGVLAVRGARA
jgi:uncharacterized membrane protein